MLVLRYLYEQIAYFLEIRDRRLESLPFTSPQSIVILLTLYLLFVLKWGPRFMQHRKPYNIDRCLLIYNAIQVFANSGIVLYVFHELIFVYTERINFMCERLDFTDSYVGRRSAQLSYCYLLLKILDLFDTIFFVLRKKTMQISFLHVYHHVAIALGAYICVSWAPGGHPWAFGLLNCFIHFIMYSYYFGTVYYPQLKSNILIKKSITQMQIIQFILAMSHLSIPLFYGDCDYPKPLLVLGISQNFVMLMLFLDFYYTAYIRPKKLKSKPKSD